MRIAIHLLREDTPRAECGAKITRGPHARTYAPTTCPACRKIVEETFAGYAALLTPESQAFLNYKDKMET